MLMTTRWPSGENRGRERHAGEVAHHLALAGVEVHQEHARLIADVLQVGDLLRGRAEARREHEFVALAQQPDVGAVLIHDRKPLAPAVARARLVDEDDLGVEVAPLAGEALVDLVGHPMRQTAPIVRVGGEPACCRSLAARARPRA